MNTSMRAFFVGYFAIATVAVQAQEQITCPDGATLNGETTPEAGESWCELPLNGTVVMHGPYRSWWPDGTLGTSGRYDRGKAVGKWSGWFPSGKLQGEQWFEDDKLVRARYWNEEGQSVTNLQPATPPPPAEPPPWTFNAPRAEGYSIDLASVSPEPGTLLRAGSRVKFTVNLTYSLSLARSGTVVLVFQDAQNRSAKAGEPQVSKTVQGPRGSLTLEDTLVIPQEADELTLFIPLVPEGIARTSGEVIIRYPIARQPPGER